MKRTMGLRLGMVVLALVVSTNAFAGFQRDGEFTPIEKLIRKIERVLRGLGDTLTLPKP